MIDDILDLTKIELNSFSLDKKWFKLEDTIKEITDIMREQLKFKNMDMHINFSDHNPNQIYTDERRLKQIQYK